MKIKTNKLQSKSLSTFMKQLRLRCFQAALLCLHFRNLFRLKMIDTCIYRINYPNSNPREGT